MNRLSGGDGQFWALASSPVFISVFMYAEFWLGVMALDAIGLAPAPLSMPRDAATLMTIAILSQGLFWGATLMVHSRPNAPYSVAHKSDMAAAGRGRSQFGVRRQRHSDGCWTRLHSR